MLQKSLITKSATLLKQEFIEGLQRYEKETPTQVFSCEYCKIFNNSCFYGTNPVAVFGLIKSIA